MKENVKKSDKKNREALPKTSRNADTAMPSSNDATPIDALTDDEMAVFDQIMGEIEGQGESVANASADGNFDSDGGEIGFIEIRKQRHVINRINMAAYAD